MTRYSVWYRRPEWFRSGVLGVRPNPRDLGETHIHVRDVLLDGGDLQLERVFSEMQGEVWSPNGEARELIREKGLAHTSMSVGDVAVVDGRVMLCRNTGFMELTKED